MERDESNLTYTKRLEDLWSEEGRAYQLEKYRPKIELVREFFGPKFPGLRFLDIGVGYGVFLNILEHDYGATDLHGMDLFPDSIEIASKYTSASIVQGDIMDEEWPVEPGGYDVITCFDVVEHLEEPGLFFRRVGKYLREGGIVIVTTPNKELPYRMRSIPWFGYSDPNTTHISVMPPRRWKKMAVDSGMEIVKAWKGEHLTHTRIFPRVFRAACSLLGLDHRKVWLVNAFEQSFCLAVRPAGSPPAE